MQEFIIVCITYIGIRSIIHLLFLLIGIIGIMMNNFKR